MPTISEKVSDLETAGPLIAIHVAPPRPAVKAIKSSLGEVSGPLPITALIDTGASVTVLKTGIAQQLQLSPTGVERVSTPTSHNVPCETFSVIFVFPGWNRGIVVFEAPLEGQTIDCLIGRDMLAHGFFVYNGKDNHFSFTL